MKSVNEIVQESIADLATRWQKARTAAIKLVESDLTDESLPPKLTDFSEEQFEKLLKAVFLNSRNLGKGYQKAYGVSWDRQDFVLYLGQMGTPCGQGAWSQLQSASALIRQGCDSGKKYGSRYCQYWREAFDGLVLGLSDTEYFARHRSLPVGDEECVDLVYDGEGEHVQSSIQKESKWGPIPEEYAQKLSETQLKFDRMGADVEFLGVSENKLFYKLSGKDNQTCGSGETIFRSSLERHIKEILPRLVLQTANPVAVYGEKS